MTITSDDLKDAARKFDQAWAIYQAELVKGGLNDDERMIRNTPPTAQMKAVFTNALAEYAESKKPRNNRCRECGGTGKDQHTDMFTQTPCGSCGGAGWV